MKYYKICLHKSYFERGLSITNWFKYPFAIIGVTNYAVSNNVNLTAFLLVFYFISCYLLGWAWFNKGFALAEAEVGNQYNEFVKEMRNKTFK